MTKHLLQIHIGPMQAFIAAARRTRDLWFGSWLMSELSKAAARGIAQHNAENKLIFPAHESDLTPGSDLGVSNKIAALVADPEGAAEKAKSALDEQYNALIAAASLPEKIPNSWPMAEKQLRSFLEFYWVSCPVDSDYLRARRYTDALLAARKNSRDFQPVCWQGTGLPKSSLDGRMETVIPPKLCAKKMYRLFRARSGEQLSGVDLLKRLGKAKGNAKSHFPSTSHMAVMPLKGLLQAKADDKKVKEAWNNYLGTLSSEIKKQEIVHKLKLPILGNLDGGLLFESRLLDFMEKKEVNEPKTALNAFLKEAGISDPNPYYALLIGDGDSMGAALSKMQDESEHRNFSQKLADFSQEARAFVESRNGAVVYAGGDDVMGLLPLDTAVSITADLAQKFHEKMDSLTFSAGIAIVHHLEPLEDALNLARQAEREAKSLDGKNALAITLNKRSGAPRTIVGHWGEIDSRLDQFATHFQNKDLPYGLAYQLRDMFLHLGGQTAVKDNPTLQAVIETEAGRIIKRKDGSDDAAKDVMAAVAALDYKKQTIETVSSELIIAAELAKVKEVTA